MKFNSAFADIILPLAVEGVFTYHVPSELLGEILLGKRVMVPFGGKKLYTGLVFDVHQNKPTGYETKPIMDVLDSKPVVNKFQLWLWQWIADYYMCSLGEVYKAALPGGLRLESDSVVVINSGVSETTLDNPNEAIVFEALQRFDALSIADLIKITGLSNPVLVIRNLIDRQLVVLNEEIREKYQPRTQKIVGLNPHFTNEDQIAICFEALKKAKKQYELFEFFLAYLEGDYFSGKTIPKSELLLLSNAGSAILKGLIDRNILVEMEESVSRLMESKIEIIKKKPLNGPQKLALEQINERFIQHDVVLLHGVTSSGKTELFIHLMEQTLEQNRQILYLLPEIALTSQIVKRLQAVFGNKVGVYHSKFSDSERVEIWNHLSDNTETGYKIILGVRSSIFLPFTNLGLIIVDEEHENTYKQFDPAPRYNARDLAVVLAKLHKAKVLLGTATPSVESYFNTKSGLYGLVELKTRYKDIEMPEILVADVRRAKNKKQMRSHFTPMLLNAVEQALAKNEQVILFQNRRGFSPYIECNQCGWIPKCQHCDVSLTYHKGISKLICHYCGYSINGVYRCGHCKQADIETKGFGTEKIEDEISLIFPDAKVGRLDLDTAKGKHSHEHIINDFQDHRIDVLIGTQMVSKGLDFDHVSVVGILNADSMLNFPDFRAHERSFQLMAQVSGRAGRKNKQGKVIVQATEAEHPIIKQVVDHDFESMFMAQLAERKAFFYPPYSRLIKVTFKHRDKQTVMDVASDFAQSVKAIGGNRLLGPTTPLVNRIQNLYLQQVLIKLERGKNLMEIKKGIVEIKHKLLVMPSYKSVTVVFDVDPA